MVRATALRLFALLLPLLAGPAVAQTAATAKYVVNWGGNNVASVNVTLSDDGSRYSLDLAANVAGLASIVASGTADISSAGTIGAGSLIAQEFLLHTRASGEDFRVTIGFKDGGDVETFIIDPPVINNIDRVAIERRHLTGVNDMLAAFILRGDALGSGLCRRDMRIFTGLERFDLEMSFVQDDVATSRRTGYQGPVVLCKVKYTPVSGHFTTSEMTKFLAGNDRIHLWYAPLGATGYFIPYRVLMSTGMGDLSMVLTGMSAGD